MRIVIINGPNLNLLGTREPELYGSVPFEDFFEKLKLRFPDIELKYLQSNIEGVLIDYIQQCETSADGIILNPAGYSHTSVAMADTLAALSIPVIEVHISNIYSREEYRHTSLTGAQCRGVISGLGLEGYALALRFLTEDFSKQERLISPSSST